MKKQIVINASKDRSRIAIVEDGELVELYVENPDNVRTIGNIYLGRVQKVMPAIRAAFVDVGQKQDCFLHFSDLTDNFPQLQVLAGEEVPGLDEPVLSLAPAKRVADDETEPDPEETLEVEPSDDESRSRRTRGRRSRGRGRGRRGGRSRSEEEEEQEEQGEGRRLPHVIDLSAPRRPKRQPAPAKTEDEPAEPETEAAETEAAETEAAETEAAETAEAPEPKKRRTRSKKSEAAEAEAAEATADAPAAEAETEAETEEPAEEERPARRSRRKKSVEPADDDASSDAASEAPDAETTDDDEDDDAAPKKRRRRRSRRGRDPKDAGEAETADETADDAELAEPEAEADAAQEEAQEEAAPKRKRLPSSIDLTSKKPARSAPSRASEDADDEADEQDDEEPKAKRSRRRSRKDEATEETAEEAADTEAEASDEEDEASSRRGRRSRSRRGSRSAETEDADDGSEEADEASGGRSSRRRSRGGRSEAEASDEADERKGGRSSDRGSSGRGSSDRNGSKNGSGRTGGKGRSGSVPPNEQLLNRDTRVLVKITKEPISTKGPRVSTDLSMAGRFLVLVPAADYVAVSKKIESAKERKRLRTLAQSLKPDGFGVIVRTVAEGRDAKSLDQDLRLLTDKWRKIEKKLQEKPEPPVLLYEDVNMVSSVIRDLFSDDYDRILVDDPKVFRNVHAYVKAVAPHMADKVELHKGRSTAFRSVGIEGQVEEAFSKRVNMRGGGYLFIETTEAMHVVDVNSGRAGRGKSQKQNLIDVNVEAAKEVAKQLRLRDLGGIIVVDFIDLKYDRDRKKVTDALKEAFKKDRAVTKVLPMSDFGLVQITRQRLRPSITTQAVDEDGEALVGAEAARAAGAGEIRSGRRDPEPEPEPDVDEAPEPRDNGRDDDDRGARDEAPERPAVPPSEATPEALTARLRGWLDRYRQEVDERYRSRPIVVRVHPLLGAYLRRGFPSPLTRWRLALRGIPFRVEEDAAVDPLAFDVRDQKSGRPLLKKYEA